MPILAISRACFAVGDPLSQRDSGAAAAKALGLEVVSDSVTYQVDTTDFTPVLLPVIQTAPIFWCCPVSRPPMRRS